MTCSEEIWVEVRRREVCLSTMSRSGVCENPRPPMVRGNLSGGTIAVR